jgi:acyl dehydratase
VNTASGDNRFWFEDHVVGDLFECASHEVSAEEITSFATQWDPQPWHIDEAAAKASVFGGLTACSAHIFSIYCITSQQWQNGKQMQALASLGFDELRMLEPVFAGDTLTCMSTVDSARVSSSKPDRGIIVYASELLNQRGEVAFAVKCATLMACDPAGRVD